MAVDILDMLTSAAGGGVLGIIGSGLKYVGNYFENKQKMAMEAQKNAHELQLIEKQSQLKVVELETEGRIASEKSASDIKLASYSVFTDMSNIYKWAATIISLNRVIITWALWILTWWIAKQAIDMRGASIIDGKDIMNQIVNNVTFCAALATTWWFGDRPPQTKR